jgi:hypothetical protein
LHCPHDQRPSAKADGHSSTVQLEGLCDTALRKRMPAHVDCDACNTQRKCTACFAGSRQHESKRRSPILHSQALFGQLNYHHNQTHCMQPATLDDVTSSCAQTLPHQASNNSIDSSSSCTLLHRLLTTDNLTRRLCPLLFRTLLTTAAALIAQLVISNSD